MREDVHDVSGGGMAWDCRSHAVLHGEEADVGAQVSGIARDLDEALRGGAEQDCVSEFSGRPVSAEQSFSASVKSWRGFAPCIPSTSST